MCALICKAKICYYCRQCKVYKYTFGNMSMYCASWTCSCSYSDTNDICKLY